MKVGNGLSVCGGVPEQCLNTPAKTTEATSQAECGQELPGSKPDLDQLPLLNHLHAQHERYTSEQGRHGCWLA